jgi:hypothetical protein
MSLVGPRPERPAYIEEFRRQVPGYMLRHKVRAGMTGWAQVHGWRGDTSIHQRVEHDLYYIQRWSLWLDLRILFMTLFRRGRSSDAIPFGESNDRIECTLDLTAVNVERDSPSAVAARDGRDELVGGARSAPGRSAQLES